MPLTATTNYKISFTEIFTSNPFLLSSFLRFIPWKTFLTLSQTCQSWRSFLEIPSTNSRTQLRKRINLRNVVLTRYVDGFGKALREAGLENLALREHLGLDLCWEDLVLLIISQQTPLHSYPTHALSVLSSGTSPETSRKSPKSRGSLKTAHLARLTLAHSRFVLVLQAVAHSSSNPPPQEGDLLVSSSTNVHFAESSYRSHNRASSAGSLRELVFPAPLAPDHGRPGSKADLGDKTWVGYPSLPASASTPSISISHTDSVSKSSKRFSMASLLGKSSRLLPPPVTEPRALREYSSSFGWRRAKFFRESAGYSSEIDDDELFSTPRRRFAGSDVRVSGSESSFSEGTSSTTSSSTSASNSTSATSISALDIDLGHNNPHALRLAASRIRAPVLRVFVPSSDMYIPKTTDFMPSSLDEGGVSRCEDELLRAGLWEYLSVGDVVCNLGYVPPSSSGSSDAVWLIFNGCQLIPFTFGAQDSRGILPIYSTLDANVPGQEVWTLPSWGYYEHLAGTNMNIRILISKIPVSPLHLEVMHQPTLISVAMNIPSPHTAGGMVVVKKWVWTLRIWVESSSSSKLFTADNEFDTELGTGWEGEWTLEGDGTKEGREVLLSCLRQDQKRMDMMEWELVRDRCGKGKVWLR
ncbi:hypothetical protein F5890DRAFT_1402024 [Lentinula detonsa]|uniref:F-box domain-containing protein n=1 Tax=Lentinula detonsa TaxID=2804962 RepID=A0AA38Q961_9AGAR|nr:hypothetical protein F5890DRAFT_1402024 [Lentinula detonsa]